ANVLSYIAVEIRIRNGHFGSLVSWSLRGTCTYPGLKLLHLLLSSLHGDLLSFIQTVLQVFDGLFHVLLHALQVSAGVSLHLLFNTKSFIPASSFSLQRTLQGIYNSLLVSLGLFHLFIFLSYLTLHVCFDLVKLELNSENLALFMLQ
uniref:Uncharacterized protein n=1 Tax=Oryzias latipes TaxID=8090 RepID=A0A3P9K6H4_ORYLA